MTSTQRLGPSLSKSEKYLLIYGAGMSKLLISSKPVDFVSELNIVTKILASNGLKLYSYVRKAILRSKISD